MFRSRNLRRFGRSSSNFFGPWLAFVSVERFAEVQCAGWVGWHDACPFINHFFHAA